MALAVRMILSAMTILIYKKNEIGGIYSVKLGIASPSISVPIGPP